MKPTNRGLMLNFALNQSRHQKLDVANNFISRNLTLSSPKKKQSDGYGQDKGIK